MRRYDIQAGTGVIIRAPNEGILLATNGSETQFNATTGVPTNGTANYMPGCIFLNKLGSIGSFWYANTGTLASSTWTNIV